MLQKCNGFVCICSFDSNVGKRCIKVGIWCFVDRPRHRKKGSWLKYIDSYLVAFRSDIVLLNDTIEQKQNMLWVLTSKSDNLAFRVSNCLIFVEMIVQSAIQ